MALVKQLSLTRAARIIGISRTMLYRYIFAGNITVTTSDDGAVSIATSEILRLREHMRFADEIEPTFLAWISVVTKEGD